MNIKEFTKCYKIKRGNKNGCEEDAYNKPFFYERGYCA
jgi:hypothetical protein